MADRAVADDLVQETLVRMLAADTRVEPWMLEPYAIVTARNVVASLADGVLLLTDDAIALVPECWTANVPVSRPSNCSGIRTHRATVVAIDITGAPDVDETVANRLLQTVDASRLVGASAATTGVRGGSLG